MYKQKICPQDLTLPETAVVTCSRCDVTGRVTVSKEKIKMYSFFILKKEEIKKDIQRQSVNKEKQSQVKDEKERQSGERQNWLFPVI